MQQEQQIYCFDDFRLDVPNRELRRDGRSVALPAKAFDMLVVLVENGGRLIGKDELFSRVWPDQIVEESNLTVQVSAIRKALGERKENPNYIVTVPGHGYRFTGNLTSLVVEEEEVVIARHSISRLIIETVEAGPSPQIKSMAVLPFKPLVADSRDEALELGLADTLITRLGSLRQVVMRPIGAVCGYTRLEQDPVAAGREQRVDAVLDGSIQKSGERIRVTVRLLNVADGHQLWSGKFDEKLTDIFGVQDSISRQVAEAIGKLTAGEKELLVKRYTQNVEAYQLYLQGRYFCNKMTEEEHRKSFGYFNRAIEKDPSYALAYAGLADAYVLASFFSMLSPAESYGKAKAAAMKALELDNQLAEAHATLGLILSWYEWDWPSGEAEFNRAIELSPNYAMSHQGYGRALAMVGRFDESLAEMKRAQELDPISLIIGEETGTTFLFARRYDEAINQIRKILDMDSRFAFAYIDLSIALEQTGRPQEAIIELQKALSLENENAFVLSLMGFIYARMGGEEKAADTFSRLTELSRRKYVSPTHIARVYAGLGKIDQAFESLEQAYQGRDYNLPYVRVDPTFDGLRSDPRFSVLVRRIGLP